ncbi:MAG: DUF1552 domain-containing protein, partial [Planctomycetales bacterium]
RTAFVFMPNGVVPEHWTPQGDAEHWDAPPMLQPLEELKQDILLVEGLWHKNTNGRNGHWPKVPAWLSGGYVERGSGGDLDTGGTSADQLMAREIGHRAALPSFELGMDSPRTGVDNIGGGFPRILGSFISWRDPHTPVQKEIAPQRAFDRLFRTGNTLPTVKGLDANDARLKNAPQRDDASILDLVLEDAKSLKQGISQSDRARLEEYMESVRAVEQRIQASIEPPVRWVNDDRFAHDRPPADGPNHHGARLRLMLDLMVLAFWTDSTRIATFMMGDAQSGQSFEFLDGLPQKSFHGISHHRNEKEPKAHYEKIGTWHVSQFAYLLRKMKSLDEGGGSLLDNCQVLFGSSLKDGNRHDSHDLPLILAGRAQGKLRPGRRVRASRDTPMCNLLLSMMDNAGLRQKRFGDSTGRLKNLG